MQKFSESLLSDMESQLKVIHSRSNDPICYAEQAIKALLPLFGKLKEFFMAYTFENRSEEIRFFRDIKPRFASRLMYYNEVYNIALNVPFCQGKSLCKYYESELRRLKGFYEMNAEFCKYYRSGSTYLDNQYFLRGKQDIRLTLDSFYLQADNGFSTSHDYKVSCIMANDLIRDYLLHEIGMLENAAAMPDAVKKLQWTGSKVALIELVYALHAASVFNSGTAELKETVAHFEAVFGVDLGQFNRTFLEIRGRKSDRTKFLTSLTQTLILRMDDADEN